MSYEVLGLLGRGGSAVVELAVDGDGRRVATKRVALSGSAAQIRVAGQRLRREAEILARLAHPGIVPVIDVIDDGSELILVFPALDENLQDRVSRLGPLPPEEVVRIGRVLLEALAAAHRHGIVHRDIKPANVMFDHGGQPALADFGVAFTSEITAGLTDIGTVVGTPMWMAPEQARGEPAGPPSDVFSLGATLNFAATGLGPYQSGRPSMVMTSAARGEIRPVPASVPHDLRRPLTRMLDARPGRRPSAAAVLGGLDGTMLTPAVQLRRGHTSALVRSIARSWSVRLLGDPAPQTTKPWRRRWLALATAVISTAVVVTLVVLATSAGARTTPMPLAPPVTTCTPLAYLPCGASLPAPHTDGLACQPGWYDLDGSAANGCESRSDYAVGTVLTQGAVLHANVVPASATDSFATHVSGSRLDLCWGSLHVTLTAPPGTAEEVTVWKGPSKVASALSANGTPATATVSKPGCFGADSENLQVDVTALAATAGASADDFTLTRDGGW